MRTDKFNEEKWMAAVLGLIIGDALGVPAEFKSRLELRNNPVTGMEGFGSHNQPAGTWSDDSSMVLATIEWFAEMVASAPDYKMLMEKFCKWFLYGDYTPHGVVFDCGISTSRAIMNYGNGTEPLQCGGCSEWENGNGSLMRILPAALWYSKELAEEENIALESIFKLSSLTHGHMRSKIGCLLYSKMVADLLFNIGNDKSTVINNSVLSIKNCLESSYYNESLLELGYFNRLWDPDFKTLAEGEIRSSGYVVDTLEAAVWCFLTTETYKDCVLKAVNLGEDTDTVGAVAGGLAGAFYGMEEIPTEWISKLARLKWIEAMVTNMVNRKKEMYER